jgi:hypothetical protein
VPLDLTQIPDNPFASKTPEETPDPPTKLGIEDLLVDREFIRNKAMWDDIVARKRYALWTFILTVAWIIGMFGLLLVQGYYGNEKKDIYTDYYGCEYTVVRSPCFSLSDKVLMTAMGTMTASIIGIFMVVMKDLFPAVGRKIPDSRKRTTKARAETPKSV